MVDSGFEIIVTAVAAEGMDKEWLGRKLDQKTLEDLARLHSQFGINPIFEGGEGETFVGWAPFFKKRIVVQDTEKRWSGSSGVLEIKRAKLT